MPPTAPRPRTVKRGATIADVAKAAGVSVPTVSRILNGKDHVADDTRQRVQEAIRTLGYAPHVQARRLRGGASMTLALHHPVGSPHDLGHVIEIPYITGAAAAASESGYFLNVLLSQLNPDALLNMYRSNQIDGAVLLQVSLDDWRVDLLRKHQLPFVMLGRCQDLEGLSFIDLDFEDAMRRAFDYLLQAGHRRLGFLTYPPAWRQAGIGPAVRSLEGFQRAVARAGISGAYREIGWNSVADGSAATDDLLAENPQVTAIITVSHATAAGSIKALTLRGRHVPQDCSVMTIGFGADAANVITPSLTTLEWNPFEISYQALSLLIEQLAQQDLPARQVLVPPQLVVRESTSAVT